VIDQAVCVGLTFLIGSQQLLAVSSEGKLLIWGARKSDLTINRLVTAFTFCLPLTNSILIAFATQALAVTITRPSIIESLLKTSDRLTLFLLKPAVDWRVCANFAIS
jgi:hypothetical protein